MISIPELERRLDDHEGAWHWVTLESPTVTAFLRLIKAANYLNRWNARPEQSHSEAWDELNAALAPFTLDEPEETR